MTPEKPTIVFVPGAWNYPSYYQLVIDRLHAYNYPTATVNHASVIPLDSGPDILRAESHYVDAEAIKAVVGPLVDAGKSVIVFCHSYGGLPTTEALANFDKTSPNAGRVTNVIYCASFAIPVGESFASIGAKFPSQASTDWHTRDDDGVTLRISGYEKMKEALCADVDDELIKQHIKLGLHSMKTLVSPLKKAAWGKIPATYILCEQDVAIPASVQQFMIDEVGIKDVVRLPASHSPFLSMPDEVFDIIDRVANQKSASL